MRYRQNRETVSEIKEGGTMMELAANVPLSPMEGARETEIILRPRRSAKQNVNLILSRKQKRLGKGLC